MTPNTESPKPPMTRRDFLRRGAIAAGVVAAPWIPGAGIWERFKGLFKPRKTVAAPSPISAEEEALRNVKFVTHKGQYEDVRIWGGDAVVDQHSTPWGSNVHVTKVMPLNAVCVLTPSQFVGTMPIRKDIVVSPFNLNSREGV